MKIYPLKNDKYENYSRFGLENIDMSEAVITVFEQNEYLFHEGNEMEYIMFILSGQAKVSISIPNGKRMLLDYYIANGIIGDLELLMGNRVALSTMRAITGLTCISLPFDRYAPRLKADITFLNWAGRELAGKFTRSNINGVSNILQTLEPRLCLYILNSSHNDVFRATMTDVSELLGTSYRHLLRTLSKLCSEGVILKKKTGYIIIDKAELKKRSSEI